MRALFYRSIAPTTALVLPVTVLHGLLGSSRNWLGFCKDKLHTPLPNLGLTLLDLRNHGQSEGFPGPHTLSSCVSDVADTVLSCGTSPASFIGHSMGGKVLLKLLDSPKAIGPLLSASVDQRLQVFVIDSFPGALQRPSASALDGVEQVLGIVSGAPSPIPTRQWVVDAATSAGLDKSVAYWLASNVTQASGGAPGFRWLFDARTAVGLYADYLATDCWPLLLAGPPAGVDLHLVMASRSSRWADAPTQALLGRVRGLQAERDDAAARSGMRSRGSVRLHVVDSGHWVHVDAPDALAGVILPELRARVASLPR